MYVYAEIILAVLLSSAGRDTNERALVYEGILPLKLVKPFIRVYIGGCVKSECTDNKFRKYPRIYILGNIGEVFVVTLQTDVTGF